MLRVRRTACEAIGYKQDDGMVAKTCAASGYENEDLAAQLAQLKEEALLAKLRTEQEQTNELITQLPRRRRSATLWLMLNMRTMERRTSC